MPSFLKSTAVALALYISLGGALLLFWVALLGVAMEDVWDRLPEGWDDWIGGGLMLFAVVSGLVAYFWTLARLLAAAGIPPGRVKWHALTAGLLPVAITVWVCGYAIANMRLGW